jgi:energy-coupling factor transporter transmembrane protein EcfT
MPALLSQNKYVIIHDMEDKKPSGAPIGLALTIYTASFFVIEILSFCYLVIITFQTEGYYPGPEALWLTMLGFVPIAIVCIVILLKTRSIGKSLLPLILIFPLFIWSYSKASTDTQQAAAQASPVDAANYNTLPRDFACPGGFLSLQSTSTQVDSAGDQGERTWVTFTPSDMGGYFDSEILAYIDPYNPHQFEINANDTASDAALTLNGCKNANGQLFTQVYSYSPVACDAPPIVESITPNVVAINEAVYTGMLRSKEFVCPSGFLNFSTGSKDGVTSTGVYYIQPNKSDVFTIRLMATIYANDPTQYFGADCELDTASNTPEGGATASSLLSECTNSQGQSFTQIYSPVSSAAISIEGRTYPL